MKNLALLHIRINEILYHCKYDLIICQYYSKKTFNYHKYHGLCAITKLKQNTINTLIVSVSNLHKTEISTLYIEYT